MHSTIIVLAFAGLSAAQSTTSLFIPGADPQPLIASIIGSDTIATTYAIECVPGTDASDCGFAGGFTLTSGPSTAAYTLSLGYENGTTSVLAFTGYFDCTLTGTTAGVCTESFGGDEANFPGMSTTTLEPSDISYMPVTLTDSLPPNTDFGTATGTGGSTSSATTPASTTKSAATASNTSVEKSSSAGKSSSTTGTGSAASQSTGSTSSSKAGAAQAMITGKAQWVVGGAAAALALL